MLDAEAIATLELYLHHLTPERAVRHADGLHDLLIRLGDLSREEIMMRAANTDDAAEWIAQLEDERRVITLTIAGERKFEKSDAGKGYHRLERSYGRFTRSFAVPNAFDTENIAADYKNGVLSVSLPKKEAAKPRQSKIEVKA